MSQACKECGHDPYGLAVDNVWVAVDLDGTLLESGHYPKLGPPKQWARESLKILRSWGLRIMYWTARTCLTEIDGKYQNVNKVIDDIKEHLVENRLWDNKDYIIPSMHKPALVYKLVDDRAIRFRNWGQVLDDISADLESKGVPIEGDKRPYIRRLVL